ncbi:MAG: zf-HC2 domain-containing protein, partial [Chloroflexi bacterium]|nr:zf-HC2 domain-containing protein [Chloroflexota bacterium]
MMARCDRELLSRYRDGEVTAEERRQVEAHLASCPDCRAILAAYGQIGRSIADLGRPRPPLALRGDLFARIARQRGLATGGSFFGTFLSGLALAGTAVFVIVVLSLFLGNLANQKSAAVATALFPPPEADDVSPASVVEVRFDKPMDTRSVESSMAITPAVTAELQWQGEKLVVKPVEGFAANTSYTLTIDNKAKSAQGVPIKEKVVLHFSTGAPGTSGRVAGSVVAATGLTVTVAANLATITSTIALAAFTSSPTAILPGRTSTPSPTATVVTHTPTPTATLVAFTPTPTATLVPSTRTPVPTPTPILPTPTPFVTSTTRVAYVYDPSVGSMYTGDWPTHLRSRGFPVSSLDMTAEPGFDLGGYNLIVVGWLSGRELAVNVAKLQNAKAPILNGYSRLVESLGQGRIFDPGNPGRTIYGKTVRVEPGGGALTAGFSSEVTVAADTAYRVPIAPRPDGLGLILATVTDEQQGVRGGPVWTASDKGIYFGFWYSKDGSNHNDAYWTFFDRSVDFLLG